MWRLFWNKKAYLDWIPAATLGMAPSMTLPNLGNSSIALEMLSGTETRIFLQQRIQPDKRSNAHVSRVSALFFELGTAIPTSGLLKREVSWWGVGNPIFYCFERPINMLTLGP